MSQSNFRSDWINDDGTFGGIKEVSGNGKAARKDKYTVFVQPKKSQHRMYSVKGVFYY